MAFAVVPPSANATPFDTKVLRDDDDDDEERGGMETTIGSVMVGDDVMRLAVMRNGDLVVMRYA
jgi:hypothetical protein